eukprot:2315943-Rhodomonas_salina.1
MSGEMALSLPRRPGTRVPPPAGTQPILIWDNFSQLPTRRAQAYLSPTHQQEIVSVNEFVSQRLPGYPGSLSKLIYAQELSCAVALCNGPWHFFPAPRLDKPELLVMRKSLRKALCASSGDGCIDRDRMILRN